MMSSCHLHGRGEREAAVKPRHYSRVAHAVHLDTPHPTPRDRHERLLPSAT